MTIPSPSMLHLIPCVRAQNYTPIEIYKDNDEIYKDIAQTYIDFMNEFYKLGCRHLQLDDTSWGEFCDKEKRKSYTKRGINLDLIQEKYVWVINEIVKAKPKDLILSMHICRGNFRSTWFSSGGYESVAEDKDLVKKRIFEATKFIPLNQLLLSTQCGFSSTEEGNNLSIDEQWAKINLVKEIALEVWK